MADESAPVSVAAPIPSAAPKKGKKVAGGPKKPKAKPTHPPTSSMVNAAIKSLKGRGGSSLSAIKKYLASNYKVDVEKLSPFIKKYLKGAVVSGTLVQTKGKGASGSFKLPAKEKKEGGGKVKLAKKSGEKKAKSAKPKETGEKKVPKPKKAAGDKVTKKKGAAATAKTAKKTGSVKSKAPKEKAAKVPKVKAKTPKPKKATGAKKATGKKTAAKK